MSLSRAALRTRGSLQNTHTTLRTRRSLQSGLYAPPLPVRLRIEDPRCSFTSSYSTPRDVPTSSTATFPTSTTREFTRATASTAVPSSITRSTREHQRRFSAAADKTDEKRKQREGQTGNIAIWIQEVTKRFQSGRTLFKDLSLSFFHGAKIGIIGANGSGKSSLLKILAGEDVEFDGKSTTKAGFRRGYLSQEPRLEEDKTVLENIYSGVLHKKVLLDRYEAITMDFSDPNLKPENMEALIEEQALVQNQIEELFCWDLERSIIIAMDALRCPDKDVLCANLSGGQKRRVALCRLLLSQPDVLLLDEPTNHLDAGSVLWLEKFLDDYKGLVIAITHDRYFLDNVAGWILEIDSGRCIPFRGNYNGWLVAKATRERIQENQETAQNKAIEREIEWLKQGTKGQQKKGKARIKRVHELVEARDERRANRRMESGALVIPEGPRLGNEIIKFTDVSFSMDGNLLFKDISFRLQQGTMLGIVGPNGAGKTTLLRLITGDLVPEKGSVEIGKTVKFAYNAQTREELKDDNNVWQEIVGNQATVDISPGQSIHARQYVSQFNFPSDAQVKRIGQLSGGERNRVHLAKSLKNGANVILLDEPTNDLDVDTLRKLEEALNDFAAIGAGVIVSHDRWFLDRVCTNILAFEPQGMVWFNGTYSEYIADRTDRLGDKDGTQKYKKLMN